MNTYFISGLGANRHVFDSLELSSFIDPIFIDWLIPFKDETLRQYAQRMAERIDTTEPFCLIGLSFGGIIAQEIHQIFPAEKIILISSVKSDKEMPKIMKTCGRYKLNKLIPSRFLTSKGILSYAFFRNLYDKRLPEITKFFAQKDKFYLSWSIEKILTWKPDFEISTDIIDHIHGDADPVFPIKYIKNAYPVDKGNHLLIMQRPKIISEFINHKLELVKNNKIKINK